MAGQRCSLSPLRVEGAELPVGPNNIKILKMCKYVISNHTGIVFLFCNMSTLTDCPLKNNKIFKKK